MIYNEKYQVFCTECCGVANLPVSNDLDSRSVSLADLKGWRFDTDNGWRCPKHFSRTELLSTPTVTKQS